MRIAKRVLAVVVCLGLMASFEGAGEGRQTSQAPGAGKAGTAVRDTRGDADARGEGSQVETISFRFAIADLKTDHQFEGQLNTFHVEYEYAGGLAGGGFDPQGHAVAANTFPYFQAVRDDIIKFATEYPDKSDFYEVFGTKICRFVMRRYPQIRRMTLTIDVPAYKEVAVDRSETIVIARRGTGRK